jgi:hypothetical protein
MTPQYADRMTQGIVGMERCLLVLSALQANVAALE